MPVPLTAVPAATRRRAGWLLTALALLLLVVGVLPWTSAAPVSVRVMAVVALLAALLVAAIAWGLLHSITLERRAAGEAALDSALAAAGGGCSCGHEHDPDELHITDTPNCAPDSPECTHSCDSCVLAHLHN